ncbi:uncharacterized protein PV09_08039 [Verruconis gallopava]|uniref:Uncharacterized protein n=1 Tax=Verruconis gallopava TaxID=253628 RepID=A0A0D1XDL5_9PEZI|nr:uncharacterized protein PV09_08039 [Verruconis gallopava]KIW00326.1 hypothetical protein PV09_08039 [Verruconis gallopava]
MAQEKIHKNIIKKFKREVRARARCREAAIAHIRRRIGPWLSKYRLHSRSRCRRLDTRKTNDYFKPNTLRNEQEPTVIVLSDRVIDECDEAKEHVDSHSGFWSAYFDTLFREQDTPRVIQGSTSNRTS